MKVTVLLGGPSAEREVSLVSGKAVIEGLCAMGHRVFASDISPDDVSALDHDTDVIFPVLHGAFGESGELQEILEARGLPFVGSGSIASRLAMNKVATKAVWRDAGLPTPPWEIITPLAPKTTLTTPCVVKPIDSGSSIDVSICANADELSRATKEILAHHDRAMVETFVSGAELTVGLLDGEPLEPIHIVAHRTFFDYQAKYNDTTTEHRFDLPPQIAHRCKEVARLANHLIGCRDLARVDMILHNEIEPVLLEINTMPGFTPTSLLPDAAAKAGLSFGVLVDKLVRLAHARGQEQSTSVFVTEAARAKRPVRKTA